MVWSTWQILVVEDGYDDQRYVTRLLTHYGVTVYLVASGEACLEVLHSITPTLILTDLQLPRMSGWQLLGAIRTTYPLMPVPLVAMTASYSCDIASRVLAAGFDAFFPKPLRVASVMQDLTAILALIGTSRDVPEVRNGANQEEDTRVEARGSASVSP